jgi:hypothetical protein
MKNYFHLQKEFIKLYKLPVNESFLSLPFVHGRVL